MPYPSVYSSSDDFIAFWSMGISVNTQCMQTDTVGPIGSRQFRLTLIDCNFSPSYNLSSITIQVSLFEYSNDIQIHYQTAAVQPWNTGVLVGMADVSISDGQSYAYNGDIPSTPWINKALRFSPVGDPCYNSPCSNYGSCSRNSSNYFAFSCQCRSGYTLPTCATYDYCATTICLNGGSCTNGAYGSSCQCTSGWYGSYCSYESYIPNYSYSAYSSGAIAGIVLGCISIFIGCLRLLVYCCLAKNANRNRPPNVVYARMPVDRADAPNRPPPPYLPPSAPSMAGEN